MSVPDPDEAPTRHGETLPPDTRAARPDDRTLPAFDAKGNPARSAPPSSPPPPPPPRPAAKPDAWAPGAAAAAAAAADGDPLLGKVLGGCRILKLLGRGAMGAVYRARQEKLDREVAIKVIRAEMMADQRMLKRFEVEARIVGKFNSAHVVMVHDVGFELGVHYLVMELVQGKNLRDHVKLLAGGRLPAGEALPLLRQAIKGLEEAQRLAVVHRDIKPDNLMITDRAVLKIADFGIAKPLHEDFSMTLTSELVGTPLYMSPEQCQGEAELDFRSDMYSLGATFYYLLTGEPPIRASSVYELIQTKTKMASLCLWKALPGLDENNPLSRVIERMTQLAREDRYDSYEALLNDLVLVEHGQTIQAPIARPRESDAPTRIGALEAGVGGERRKGGQRRWLVAAAVVALAAGGGAYAWLNRPEPAPVTGPGPGDNGKAFADTVAGVRTSLRASGPTTALRDQVGKLLVATKEQETIKNNLLRDIEAGFAVGAALAAVERPALEPPFKGLAPFLAAVDKAGKHAVDIGPEVAEWCAARTAATRNERQLGADAVTNLTGAFTKWQRDAASASNDETRRAALRQRLDGIVTGRATLIAALPDVAKTLDDNLKQEWLDQARDLLASGRTNVVDVDATAELAAMRADFAAKGPEASLRTRAAQLQVSRPEQVTERAALVDAMDVAARSVEQATNLRTQMFPTAPVAPFTAVTEYWQALDRAFDPVRGADRELPAWAQQQRTQLRAEPVLQGAVVGACTSLWSRWQREQKDTPLAAAGLAALRDAKVRAVELFPGARAELDAAIPEGELATAGTSVARAAARQQWTSDAERLTQKLAGVTKLAEWTPIATEVATSLAALRKAEAAFGADADVAATVQRLTAGAERWPAVLARLAEFDARLGAGDLTAATTIARTGVAGADGRAEFTTAITAATECTAAFDALARSLDVAAAETALREAQGRLLELGNAVRGTGRIGEWLGSVEQLRTAAAGMVPIPAGRTKDGTAVPAFFLAPTECSRAEYATFLAALRAELDGITDAQQRLAKLAPRLGGIGLTADALAEMLGREVKADRMPVENATWYMAAACAAWQGRALPTAAEWALAAFGDGGKRTYSWGDQWRPDPKERNTNNTAAVEVDSNGLSWRSADGGPRIHHLGGNVAEWLAAEPTATQASLAGGRYSDGEATAKELAAGRVFDTIKSDVRKGFGFRTVLRPRQVFGVSWPK